MNRLDKLLLEEPESYYWIGFLQADGNINKNGAIAIGISKKDLIIINNFCNYLEIKRTTNKPTVHTSNKKYIHKILNKYKLNINKTYNPPESLNIKNDKLFISWLIGFIDGDGCISKNKQHQHYNLQIKLHKSWIHILDEIRIKLELLNNVKIPKAKINNQGYAVLMITRHSIIRYLKVKAVEYKLPYLKRKWDKVDLNFSKYEIADYRKQIIFKMIKEKVIKKDIASFLGVSPSTISNTIKHYKTVWR